MWVKAIADMVASLCNWRTTISNNQTAHEIISDKHDLEKACRYADIALMIVERKATFVDARNQQRFDRFVKRFRRFR